MMIVEEDLASKAYSLILKMVVLPVRNISGDIHNPRVQPQISEHEVLEADADWVIHVCVQHINRELDPPGK